MVFSLKLNMFFKDHTNIVDKEKINKIHELSTENLFALLRNIEEEPKSYTKSIIQCVYDCMYDKHIICM